MEKIINLVPLTPPTIALEKTVGLTLNEVEFSTGNIPVAGVYSPNVTTVSQIYFYPDQWIEILSCGISVPFGLVSGTVRPTVKLLQKNGLVYSPVWIGQCQWVPIVESVGETIQPFVGGLPVYREMRMQISGRISLVGVPAELLGQEVPIDISVKIKCDERGITV